MGRSGDGSTWTPIMLSLFQDDVTYEHQPVLWRQCGSCRAVAGGCSPTGATTLQQQGVHPVSHAKTVSSKAGAPHHLLHFDFVF